MRVPGLASQLFNGKSLRVALVGADSHGHVINEHFPSAGLSLLFFLLLSNKQLELRIRVGADRLLPMKLQQLAYTTAVVSAVSVLAETDSPAETTIIPAATQVTPVPGENLFGFETLQLVEDSLEQLDESNRTLFEFADEEDIDALAKRTFFKCKVFPGDWLWPAKWTWKIFDLLSGGALIKTVPQAISCYEGPAYDKEKCEYLTAEWTNSYIQLVSPFLPSRHRMLSK